MSEQLEDAIAKLRALPPELQRTMIREIHNFAVTEGGAEGAYILSAAEKAAFDEGIAQIEAGQSVAYEEFREELTAMIEE